MRFLFLTILFMSFSAHAWVTFIQGGATEAMESPASRAVVSLTDQDGVEYCTGVAVSRRWILTSAHCVQEQPEVYLKNAGRIFATAEQVIVHPLYAGEADQWDVVPSWDLALIRLMKPLPQNMTPAEIASGRDSLDVGQPLLLSGYGIGSNSTQSPDTTSLNVFKLNKPAHAIILKTLSDRGICYGDSGGPAYKLRGQQLIVYGIASHFVGNADFDCRNDVLYTDVRVLRDWILRQIYGLQRGDK